VELGGSTAEIVVELSSMTETRIYDCQPSSVPSVARGVRRTRPEAVLSNWVSSFMLSSRSLASTVTKCASCSRVVISLTRFLGADFLRFGVRFAALCPRNIRFDAGLGSLRIAEGNESCEDEENEDAEEEEERE
jgi:hypothetical protein